MTDDEVAEVRSILAAGLRTGIIADVRSDLVMDTPDDPMLDAEAERIGGDIAKAISECMYPISRHPPTARMSSTCTECARSWTAYISTEPRKSGWWRCGCPCESDE